MGRKNINAGYRSRRGLSSVAREGQPFSIDKLMADLEKMPVTRRSPTTAYRANSAHIIRRAIGTEHIVQNAPNSSSQEKLIGCFFLPYFLTIKGGGFSEDEAQEHIARLKNPEDITFERGAITDFSKYGNHHVVTDIDNAARAMLLADRRQISSQFSRNSGKELVFPNFRKLQLGVFSNDAFMEEAKELYDQQLPQHLTLAIPEVVELPLR